MERHASFEKLKRQANSSSINNLMTTTKEHKLICFIDLLRASVVSSQNTNDNPTLTNSQTNSVKYGR